jgi:DNA-binding response OmpR family regulator
MESTCRRRNGYSLISIYLSMTKVILVVDDEPLLRAFVRTILEDSGYAVKEAANVHDALILLDADGIDAVLTDIEMPGGLSGLDLAKMIRAMWPSMPLILMSGRTLPRPGELLAHASILTKPFSPERLVGMMRATA